MVKFLDLKSQYSIYKTEIDEAIFAVIEKSAFIGGPFVEEFERSFSAYCNTEFCVGVGNGTDALEIAIEALGLPAGSEIIVPANSFIASSEAVTRLGHKVVFADVQAGSYLFDLEDITARISDNTKAIIAVHLYGHPCDMDMIKAIADEYDLKVIEDCAQAHGAEYKGRRVGSIGDVATFSFYPGKNLGAYGDGGAVVTNNEYLAEKSRMIANHGRLAKYDHEFEGRNSRLDGLQAAVLSVKLKYIEEWTEKRIQVADMYLEGLRGIPEVILPVREEWAKQVYHLFVIRTKRRDELKAFLQSKEIQTGVHYPTALNKLSAYQYLGQSDDCPLAVDFSNQLLSLPIGEHLDKYCIEAVIAAIKEFFEV
jgi:dTDP-4-amino-4,6-dideoxygalactose transaminase